MSDLVCVPATPVTDLAPGGDDQLHRQPHHHPGRHRRRQLLQRGLRRRRRRTAPPRPATTSPRRATKNPALSITKVDDVENYDSVGDVISYTIQATNTGNVTLHNVDVTDAQVSDLVCVPATPVTDLAPGGVINCTASHTITQADIDAGSFFNEACVDDGALGAAEACDDVTTVGKPRLIIIKHVINDNGGTAVAANFTLDSGGTNDTPDDFAGAESPGTTVILDAGNYVVTESGPSGYDASYSIDCIGSIADGQTKTCTVTNDDIAPRLIVIKHVINDDTGTADAADFTLDSGGTNDTPDNFAGAESPGTTVTLNVGSYNVTETGPTGYAATFSADCSGSIAVGQTKTCTVTNDDVEPPPGGRLMHTGTTCQQYTGTVPPSGLAGTDIEAVQYATKNGKINTASPGVFFYFTTFEAPSANFTVNVAQAITPPNTFTTLFDVHQAQVNIFTADCSAFGGATVTSTANGQVAVHFTSATAGNDYIIQVKYTTKSVVGKATPSPTSVDYTFQTKIGAIVVDEDPEGLTLEPK